MNNLNIVRWLAFCALATLALLTNVGASETNSIANLDLSKISQNWGTPHADKSVDGNEITMGGEKFAHGLGTHSESLFRLQLDKKGELFTAKVGIDDETQNRGSAIFRVVGDDKVLWESSRLAGGQKAIDCVVDLNGVRELSLMVSDAGDGINFAHADWADAQIVMRDGVPEVLPAVIPEKAVILTPPASHKPRINTAQVFGVRPGSPFLFVVAATGDRPMTFLADGLPPGLELNSESGRITGSLTNAGEYIVKLHAKNMLGSAERTLKVICGSRIGLTPAMGWNSWNCFANAVTAEKVKAAADAMVKSGLANHGWTYINIDDFWQVHHESSDPTLQGPRRDAEGDILPNPRFPDMKGLADYVHSKGLKIGLYSTPGPWTCGGCVGSFDHELQDAEQYAKWGFDYLKYDWCSYKPELEGARTGSSGFVASVKDWNGPGGQERARFVRPYAIMRKALDAQPRDLLFSFCQYGMNNVWEWCGEVGGNSCRTTDDIVDTWASMSGNGFSQNGHEKYAGPGHFNDPDMLVLGRVGWGPSLHPTRLTPNEQYTHISLWCLLSSPLLIGCDMTQLDDFTLNLLSNDEVIEVDQDSLGRQAARVFFQGYAEVWAKELEDGSRAVGLFNRGPDDASVEINWSDLGLAGRHNVRDLWRQKDLGQFSGQFGAVVPRHGVVLVKVSR